MEEITNMIIRLRGDVDTRQVWIDGVPLDPKPSQDSMNLSSKFAWGYSGFGGMQLSLAILLKFTDELTALENYRFFYWEIICELDPGDFESRVNLSPWLSRKEVVS